MSTNQIPSINDLDANGHEEFMARDFDFNSDRAPIPAAYQGEEFESSEPARNAIRHLRTRLGEDATEKIGRTVVFVTDRAIVRAIKQACEATLGQTDAGAIDAVLAMAYEYVRAGERGAYHRMMKALSKRPDTVRDHLFYTWVSSRVDLRRATGRSRAEWQNLYQRCLNEQWCLEAKSVQ